MPRKPRTYLAGVPCHVIQRGNNRQPCFFSPADCRFYLGCLADAAGRHGVEIHAYVLMTNHTHLLVTPRSAEAISLAMQSLGRRYVQYVNYKYRRCGTLWESRHKASLVDAERYLLACYRYIELNPVRAGMVRHPGEYAWSSYRCNACGEPNALLVPHAAYGLLGPTDETRRAAYRELVESGLEPSLAQDIRAAATASRPLGDAGFRARIERETGRSVGRPGRGRPGKRRGFGQPDAN